MYETLVRISCAVKMVRAMQKAGAVSSETGGGRQGGSVTIHFAERQDCQEFHARTVMFGASMKPGNIVSMRKAICNWLSQTGYEA